jgi:pyrimidine-specific ribonucleoside hydrolase
MRRRSARGTGVVLAIVLTITACGGSDAVDAPAAPAPAPPAEPAPSPPPEPAPEAEPPATAPSGHAVPDADAVRVVVDTDLSTDDLMAIAMLVASPRVDVAAVTITGAFVRCPGGADLLLGVLAGFGADDVPVACGTTRPLEGTRAFPGDWRGLADRAWGIPLTPTDARPVEGGGVALLRRAIEDGASTVVVLGPHTNLATALRETPDLVRRIDGVLTMGGAVDVPGNVYTEGPQPPVAEWNIYVDPRAAAEVFGSGVPITMVGLDATNEVPVSREAVERLARDGSGPALEMMADMLVRNRLVDAFDSYFWDQLAVAVLLDPAVVRLETTGIRVVTSDGPDSGRTVRDPAGSEIAVAVGADPRLLETLMTASLSGR